MVGLSHLALLERWTRPIIHAQDRVRGVINGGLASISDRVRKTANSALDFYITKFDRIDFFPRKLTATLHISSGFALLLLIKRTACSIFFMENQILRSSSFETLPWGPIELGIWANLLVIIMHQLRCLRATATERANLAKLKNVLSKPAKDLNTEEIAFFKEQCRTAIGNHCFNVRLAKEVGFHSDILRHLSFVTIFLNKEQDLKKIEVNLSSLYNQLQNPPSQDPQKRKLTEISYAYRFRYFEHYEEHFGLLATDPYFTLLKNIITLSKKILLLIFLEPTLIKDGSLVILDLNKQVLYEGKNPDLYLFAYANLMTTCAHGHAGFKWGGQRNVKFSHLTNIGGPVIHDLVDHLSIFLCSNYYEIDFPKLITPLGKQILMRQLRRQKRQMKKGNNVSYVVLAREMFSRILNNHANKGHNNIDLSMQRWPQTFWNKRRKTPGDPSKISFEGNHRKMICSEWTAKSLVYCIYLLNLELHQKHLSSHQKNPNCCGIQTSELPQLVNFGYVNSPISPYRELGKILPYDLVTNPAFVHTRKPLGTLEGILED